MHLARAPCRCDKYPRGRGLSTSVRGITLSELSRSLKIDRPLEDLAEILGTRPADWLLPFARIAVHAGESAGDRRAEEISRGPRPTRHVQIDITDLPPGDEPDRVDFAVVWETSGFRWVFPSFDGRIVAVRDEGGCLITIEGSYRDPLSASGPAGSEAASAAASASATTLLNVVRTAIEEQARQGA